MSFESDTAKDLYKYMVEEGGYGEKTIYNTMLRRAKAAAKFDEMYEAKQKGNMTKYNKLYEQAKDMGFDDRTIKKEIANAAPKDKKSSGLRSAILN